MSEASIGNVDEPTRDLTQQDRLIRALELLVQREAAAAGKRHRDWDALAAVIASFIGLLALAVSGYTAYVQREQLRAQVWPHLTIESSNVDSAWHVTNVGTGPARVTAMRVLVDGVPATTWYDVMKAAGYRGGEGVTRSYISRAILPAGKQVRFARPDAGEPSQVRFKDLLPDGKHELHVTLCYCSVLDDCWVASSSDRMLDGRPITSDGCPITVAERFVQ